jgi:hypothetical protein
MCLSVFSSVAVTEELKLLIAQASLGKGVGVKCEDKSFIQSQVIPSFHRHNCIAL